jgi:hypothetical protein
MPASTSWPSSRPVVEAISTSRTRGGFRLALDLHLGAARRDVDAEPILDRDQVAVELAEQRPEQVRLGELKLDPGARRGGGGSGRLFGLRHQAASSVRAER